LDLSAQRRLNRRHDDAWHRRDPRSAPDIAGHGVADPIGAIRSAALMAEHLGHAGTADEIVAAIADVLAKGTA
jgi:isocitrate/isopropylmalate dehydrogenase